MQTSIVTLIIFEAEAGEDIVIVFFVFSFSFTVRLTMVCIFFDLSE